MRAPQNKMTGGRILLHFYSNLKKLRKRERERGSSWSLRGRNESQSQLIKREVGGREKV